MTIGHKRDHKPIGDPRKTNAIHARHAQKAIETYAEAAGTTGSLVTDLQDLLASLAVWCDREGYDFAHALEHAANYYAIETRAANARQANGAQFERITIARAKL